MYVDDDTDVVHESDPEKLKEKIQLEAYNSCQWLKDNRMCVAGEESKLLIIGTKKLRNLKLNHTLDILVYGKRVQETKSEKLLGVIINNQLTWQEHLY